MWNEGCYRGNDSNKAVEIVEIKIKMEYAGNAQQVRRQIWSKKLDKLFQMKLSFIRKLFHAWSPV